MYIHIIYIYISFTRTELVMNEGDNLKTYVEKSQAKSGQVMKRRILLHTHLFTLGSHIQTKDTKAKHD